MKKLDIKKEVDKVVEKVTNVASDQLDHAKVLQEEIALSIHQKQVEQKKVNKKVGKQIKRGIEDIKQDVDQTVQKITKTMDKASNKR
jgi:hypothetical protein